MNLRPLVAATLLLAGYAHANMIALSGTANVSVSGHASSGTINGGGGDSYAVAQSAAAPFATFNGSVSDSATWTIPPPGEILFGPQTFSASSQATQLATFGPNAISISGSLSAQHSANVGAPYAFASASANSVFDVTFRIEEFVTYALSLNAMATHGHGFTIAPPAFSLTALGGGLSLGMDDVTQSGPATWAYNGAGLLAPGDYRLVYSLSTATFGDPLGDFDTRNFSLNLNVSSVPDAGATLLLLALALVAVAALRRHGARA